MTHQVVVLWLLVYHAGPASISVQDIVSRAACEALGTKIQMDKGHEFRTNPFSCFQYRAGKVGRSCN